MPCPDSSTSTEHLVQSLCSLKGDHEEEVGPTRSDGGKKGVGRLLPRCKVALHLHVAHDHVEFASDIAEITQQRGARLLSLRVSVCWSLHKLGQEYKCLAALMRGTQPGLSILMADMQ